MDWIELGYFGLFLASFLAATILPFSSEIILAGVLAAGFDPVLCLFVASFGNWLGDWKKISKWLRVDAHQIDRWRPQINRYGPWTALLCWLPFVGDPLAIALGVFRVRILPVSIFMVLGKFLRYLLVLKLLSWNGAIFLFERSSAWNLVQVG